MMLVALLVKTSKELVECEGFTRVWRELGTVGARVGSEGKGGW